MIPTYSLMNYLCIKHWYTISCCVRKRSVSISFSKYFQRIIGKSFLQIIHDKFNIIFISSLFALNIKARVNLYA